MEIKQLCFSYLCHDVQTLKKKKRNNKQTEGVYVYNWWARQKWVISSQKW